MRRRALLLLALLPAGAAAASLSVAKSATVVSDVLGLVRPRALPGSIVDYALMVTNPVGNLLATVQGETIEDDVPTHLALRVADLGAAGSGPVEFMDGGLLGLGLTNSGLTYRYAGLASTSDALDFSDGTGWTYAPSPDAEGYDPRVRAIRVRLTGAHLVAGSYRLRIARGSADGRPCRGLAHGDAGARGGRADRRRGDRPSESGRSNVLATRWLQKQDAARACAEAS